MSVFDVAPDSEDEAAEVVKVSSEDEDDEALQGPRPDAPPLRFRGYRRGQELGSGASGKVFLCHRKDCCGGFAVKAVDLRRLQLSPNAEREYTSLCREVEILKSLPPHQEIVQLIDAFEEGHWFLLVLELVGGGDLFTVLTAREPPQLKEREAAFVLRQLAHGLHFLHSQNVIHRDLKLENILVASERREQGLVFYSVKITDFGLSKFVGVGFSAARSVVGTRPYTAPEVEHGASYDFSADLWCLGVVLYVLLAGHFPFDRTPTKQAELERIVFRIKGGKTAKSLASGLLRLDPADRLTLEGLSSHEWLQDPLEQDGLEGPSKRLRRAANNTPRSSVKAPAKASQGTGASPNSAAPTATATVVQADTPSPTVAAAAESSAVAAAEVNESVVEVASTQEASQSLAPQSLYRSGVREWLAHIYSSERGEVGERATVVPMGSATTPSPGPAELVYPASSKTDVMQVHMAIPGGLTGAVLGKVGVHMKQLAAIVGCKVRMASCRGINDHLVIMIGNYNQCAIVQELVCARLGEALRAEGREPPVQLEVVLLVRAEAAGVVVGKQGFVLSQIRKQSGVTIHLLHEHVQGQRPCVLSGSLANILRAQRHVFHLVRIVPTAMPVAATQEIPWSPAPASPPLPWGSPFPATPWPSPPPSP